MDMQHLVRSWILAQMCSALNKMIHKAKDNTWSALCVLAALHTAMHEGQNRNGSGFFILLQSVPDRSACCRTPLMDNNPCATYVTSLFQLF
jgi:hypothetical protein